MDVTTNANKLEALLLRMVTDARRSLRDGEVADANTTLVQLEMVLFDQMLRQAGQSA